jgi:glucan 1,3-beta-glucosidase
MQAYQKIETVSGTHDIELWTGETGWPTSTILPCFVTVCTEVRTRNVLILPSASAVRQDNAVGGMTSASQFWSRSICGMLNWGYNVLYFEAFDEYGRDPSPASTGKRIDEAHWGAMYMNRTTKFPLAC